MSPDHTPVADARSRRTAFLSVAGLAAFAVGLPLTRVLVDAPEFFLAHDAGRWPTLRFFTLVLWGIPVVAGVASALPGRAGSTVRAVVVFVLGLAAIASLLQPVSGLTWLFRVAVVVGAAALAWGDRLVPAVRSTLVWLAPLLVVLPVWVVGPSRVGSYVRAGEAGVVEVEVARAEVPVVVLVFDELPTTALLDSALVINEERFANFAALAATSDWFRNAASVSPQTSASVPAILSGRRPDLAAVPVSAAHPDNLFLQLGGTHDVEAYEPMTSLCPSAVCGDGAVGGETTAARDPGSRSMRSDAWVVLRHALGSAAAREGLPSINQGWAGFGGSDARIEPDGDGEPPAPAYGTFPGEARVARELVAGPGRSERPELIVAHLVAPHLPWVALHDGSTYRADGVAGLEPVGGTLAWGDDEGHRRLGYQRMLLQLGALDLLLGDVRSALEERGIWDEALVVVTADHGIQFEPGGIRAVGAGGAEVTGVPLFVKKPGQQRGTIDDRAALTIDVVPTILHELGVRTSSRFDGLDLYADQIPAVREEAFLVVEGTAVTPDQSVQALRRVVAKRSAWIDPDAGWSSVYQPGVPTSVVGSEVSSLGSAGGEPVLWRPANEDGIDGPVAELLVDLPSPGGWTVLALCDDAVAGAAAVDQPGSGPLPVTIVREPGRCPEAAAPSVAAIDGASGLHLGWRTS